MENLILNNGNKMPVLGLGTWRSDKGKVGEAVAYAIKESGYIHIDCASIYGNEAEIGSSLATTIDKVVQRQDIFITSKLWNTEHHPDNVVPACKKTLKNLQLEYLDLYLMHWGVAFAHSGDSEPIGKDGKVITEPVSIRETWGAMEQLVDKGLVKAIGVANFTTIMLVDLLTYARIKPAVNQIELHPYNAQPELLEFCHHNGIIVTAYSPLGSMAKQGSTVLRPLDDKTVGKIAAAHDKTPAQILIRWGIQRGTVVIPKSTTPARIKENASVFDFKLTVPEMEQISALNQNYRFVDPSEWWGIPYFK